MLVHYIGTNGKTLEYTLKQSDIIAMQSFLMNHSYCIGLYYSVAGFFK